MSRIPASFRGVQFEALDESAESGRRVAVFEYPRRELPGSLDLGRKARRYTIAGYIAAAQAPLLAAALETPGAGLLIHPAAGAVSVVVESYTQSTSTRDVRHAYFDLAFVESGDPELIVFVDATAGLTDAAGAAASAASAFFAATLTATDAAINQIRDATAAVRRYTTEGPIAAALQRAQDLAVALDDLDRETVAALTSPERYAERLVAALSIVGSLRVLSLLTGGTTGTITPAAPATAPEQTDRNNREAIRRLYAHNALAAHAAALTTDLPPSRAEATAALNVLLARIEREAAITAEPALGDLRAATIAAAGERIAALPEVETVNFEVLTDWRTEASRRGADPEYLATLNDTPHPGFVVGLQAVTRG
jgi:prophage DNA circulation protein